MSKRAIIYARVSTDMQRDNFSIPSQVAECLKYAEKRGYSVVGNQYVDPGTGFDKVQGGGAIPAFVDDFTSRELSRPSLDAAILYLETVGYDVVIVHALDRLARDPYIRQTLERELLTRGAKVEYVLGNYDESPEGEVRKDLDATFAKWENAKRTERFNRGKIRKAESGLFVTGKAPYGYKWDKNAPAGLAVYEDQAAIVQWIFRMYVEGLSINSIINKLGERGINSYHGVRRWPNVSINRMLKNTIYVGRAYYNKSKVMSGNHRERRDDSQWVEIPVTPIVDQWMFDEAQKRFVENKERLRRQPRRFYMLAGMVICRECQKPYITQTYNAGKQRRCKDRQIYRHRLDRGHCMNRTVRASDLEHIVWQQIVEILKDPYTLRRGYEEALEEQKSLYARQQAHLEILNKRKTKLEQAKLNLNRAYIDPDLQMTKAEYIEQKTRIDDELREIQHDIDARLQEIARIPTPMDLQDIEAFSARVCQHLDITDPTPQDKRRVLQLLHTTVILGADGSVSLEGWFISQDDGNDRWNPQSSKTNQNAGGGSSGSGGLLDQQLRCKAAHRRCPPRPR